MSLINCSSTNNRAVVITARFAIHSGFKCGGDTKLEGNRMARAKLTTDERTNEKTFLFSNYLILECDGSTSNDSFKERSDFNYFIK